MPPRLSLNLLHKTAKKQNNSSVDDFLKLNSDTELRKKSRVEHDFNYLRPHKPSMDARSHPDPLSREPGPFEHSYYYQQILSSHAELESRIHVLHKQVNTPSAYQQQVAMQKSNIEMELRALQNKISQTQVALASQNHVLENRSDYKVNQGHAMDELAFIRASGEPSNYRETTVQCSEAQDPRLQQSRQIVDPNKIYLQTSFVGESLHSPRVGHSVGDFLVSKNASGNSSTPLLARSGYDHGGPDVQLVFGSLGDKDDLQENVATPRKLRHQAADKTRRKRMKNSIDKLRDLLHLGRSSRTDQASILEHAVDHLQQVQVDQERLRNENENLKNQLALMIRQINIKDKDMSNTSLSSSVTQQIPLLPSAVAVQSHVPMVDHYLNDNNQNAKSKLVSHEQQHWQKLTTCEIPSEGIFVMTASSTGQQVI